MIGQNWSSNKVLLDMEGVTYIDSRAIGWLVACHIQFSKNGGMMVLYSLPMNVSQIFELLKIGSLFSLVEDRQAAELAAAGESGGEG